MAPGEADIGIADGQWETAGGLPPGIDRLAIARRFEPVIRYTQGELFFPMAVQDYVARAALWSRSAEPTGRRDRARVRLADHGELTLDGLLDRAAEHRDRRLELRTVPGPLTRRERLQWRRRPDRARLSSTSRLATVGLIGRLIDVLFRLSLVIRGAVPGGLTAAIQQAHPTPVDPHAGHPYYAHVSSNGRYLVVQYWFFYAMNDWRSTFGGVNDHEADWEQVTVFLAPRDGWSNPAGRALPTDPGDWRVAWVAFSSHDETGDDLRRRADDPDITWVGGTHPVVHAGAGSHSGAYLPGDYLIRVEPPALQRFLAVVRRVRRTLFPWTADDEGKGLGIPYVDYARGDGRHIGPGTPHPWLPVLVDDTTPWVRDYPGLWGLDTDDPFGGERAPGGPRYERGGTIRASWSDPVGWAGLAKVPATAAELHATQAARLATLDRRERQLTARIERRTHDLQRAAVGLGAVPPALARDRGGLGVRRRVREKESDLAGLLLERRSLVVEREYLQRAITRPPAPAPHDHLRHRAVPDIDPDRPPGLLLRVWTEISLSVLLALFGVALLLGFDSALLLAAVAILGVTGVEAVLRGRIATYLIGLAVLVVIGGAVYLALTNLRVALAGLLILAAVAGAVANLRALLRRR